MSDRLGDLEELREGLRGRMAECQSDQNYAVLGRLLADVVKQIDELGGGEKPAEKETGLSDFERRLQERQAGAAGKGKAAR